MTPILGFTPDMDPTAPGVILECSEVVGTDVGMKAAPTSTSVGLPALAAACRGAAVLRNLSDNRRLIAGTAAALFEAGASSWTDVSRVGGYSLGTDDRWSFAQFGNAALASSIANKIQRSLSGAFADIASAPQAKIIFSVQAFVMALHTNDAGFGDSPDRWWCCAASDETNWTPSVSTQAGTGRLVSTPGPLTAGARLGDDAVAYKKRALYLGRYSGGAEIWNWTLISAEIGCVGQDAAVDIGVAHIFVAEDDIYMFDGIRPQSIATGKVRQWFVDDRDPAYAYRTRILWDRQNALAWIFYASNGSAGAVDSGLVYHTKSGRWGVVARNVEAAVAYFSASITYDGGASFITTYDSGPSITYDSPFWVAGTETPAIFETDHIVKTLSGTPSSSSFTTGDMGDEDSYSFSDQFKVRYKRSPTSATVTGYTKDDGGSLTLSSASSVSRNDGAFDVRQSGRWHRFKVDQTGACEFSAVRANMKFAGSR